MSNYIPYDKRRDISIGGLLGLTFTSVVGEVNGESIVFKTADGREFRMYHGQDCCESVYIQDIVGDLQDLVGAPLVVAEAPSSEDSKQLGEYDESFTWTFYKLATRKGYVDIRWYGTSNGYYSESVDLVEVI